MKLIAKKYTTDKNAYYYCDFHEVAKGIKWTDMLKERVFLSAG